VPKLVRSNAPLHHNKTGAKDLADQRGANDIDCYLVAVSVLRKSVEYSWLTGDCMKAANTVALALVLIVSPIHAKDNHAPLPASVMAAKTVYIDNQTSEAAITDRAYDALTKWGDSKS